MARDLSKAQPFPATSWSLVARAAQADGTTFRAALDELLRKYLPALKTHLVLTRKLPPDRADDLLQGFVASRVVENALVSRADQKQGKFRTFLLAALNNYVIDQLRAEGAKKRSPGAGAIRELDDEHDRQESKRSRRDDPASAFDVAWAREVMNQAVERMRRECEQSGRTDLWGVFHGRVVAPALDGVEPLDYDALVRQFGFASPDQASNALVTAKRTFQRILRQVVGEYEGGEQVDEELRDLKSILGRQ